MMKLEGFLRGNCYQLRGNPTLDFLNYPVLDFLVKI